jgi:nucleoid-associated protein YgaU
VPAAAGEWLRRAQIAASAFLHDRRKVTVTGSVLGALIVVLAVVLLVRKPAEVRASAAAAPAAGAPAAQVAAQDAPEKAPAGTPAAPSAVAAKPASAKPAPAKAEAASGTVGLAVLPWGEVFVNGRSRGVSPPLKNLKLAPGTYTIEVRNTTFAPLKQKVQVKAREEVTVRHVFK